MTEHYEPTTEQLASSDIRIGYGTFLPRLRALLTTLPDVRLAYFQPGPAEDQLCLAGPDRARVILCFARSVSGEHIGKRLGKIRRALKPHALEDVEYLDIENLDYREACEVAFNAQVAYGSMETVERDRLYRYNVFLEWNASRRVNGAKQDAAPALVPPLERQPGVVSVQAFVTPLYRQLKLIDYNLDELIRMGSMDVKEFEADTTQKSLAESLMLKSIQSTILVTMSIIHRNMRLAARDYRDLFLLLPLYGMMPREKAAKLAKCAEVRDRLMFQYDEVSAIEVFGLIPEVRDTLLDFKTFMLEWLFDRYYGPSGEVLQTE